jgi:hypothetical protein
MRLGWIASLLAIPFWIMLLFSSNVPLLLLANFILLGLSFYILQWFLAHLISIILHVAFGRPTAWLFASPLNFGPAPTGIGFNLGVVYLAWIAGVLILYPLCRWFNGVKQRRRDWWLSYL